MFKPCKNSITAGIINSYFTKDKLYNNWKQNETNIKLKLEYKNYRKTLDKLIKVAKNHYLS